MKRDYTLDTFLLLLRAGLWGKVDVNFNDSLNLKGKVDWEKLYQLAQEQSVQGHVLQGIDCFKNCNYNINIPQRLLLQWIGEVQIIEQKNRAMNIFIAELIMKLRKHDIYTILVKGQGIGQCYEKPMWRVSGDVDLFMTVENYNKAKSFLLPMATHVEEEGILEKHLGMTIDGYVVELHGTLYGGLSARVDNELNDVQKETFYRGNVCSWNNNGVQIFLLGIENNVFYVFTHFLQHFYKEGVGLRQICDWCRLLYTNKNILNYELVEKRIRRVGLTTEWKAFHNLASRFLGFPDFGSQDSQARISQQRSNTGLMVYDSRFDKKADRIIEFIIKTGNMGNNRDMSHFSKYPYLIRKCISMGRRIRDIINHTRIFPLDSLRFFPRIMFNGIVSTLRGE